MHTNNISWNCKTSDGSILGGFTDDGSWRELKNAILTKKTKVISLNIRNKHGGATIDDNADGYFIANKMLAKMGGSVNEYIGIGYWRSHEDVVRIKWYDSNTMELWANETRHLNECSQDCLIKNI